MYVCTCVYIILYICVCVLYILLYIIETFIWHMVVDLKAFIRNGPCHIQGPLVPHIITTPFTAPDACLHPQRQTWHSHAPPHCGGILTCQARRESRQVDTPPSWMLGKLPSECWKTHQGSLRNKMIYKWSTNDLQMMVLFIWVADKITFYPQWTWPKWVPYRVWRFIFPCYVSK